jgi:hypothetical protein
VTQNSSAFDAHAEVPADDAQTDLIAARIRQNASRVQPSVDSRLPSFALEHAVWGDLGHLHAAHDVAELPLTSSRRFIGPLVVRVKRALRSGLSPLPESQSAWNGANARVVTFLLRQLAAQARTIESLERQVSELHDERHR